jgi:hypothetical protein
VTALTLSWARPDVIAWILLAVLACKNAWHCSLVIAFHSTVGM